MDIPIKTTRSYSRTNKYQREDSFRTDENKGKNNIPRMGWFCASVTLEILNVCWLFITWRSKEVQGDWWIKLQKMRVFKEKYNKQVICWYYIKKWSLLFIQNILMPAIYSHVHLLRISNINQTWLRTFQDKWIYHLKNRDWRTVSNSKYNKYNASLPGMLRQNTVEGHMQKTKLY